jgi:DNA-binding transcriptional MerR regulator
VADTDVEIPNRDLFKAGEVCELVSVQPYVLRSWELEFPTLGQAKTPGGVRTYRKADVELALRIKRLLFAEGLTLAGARRRIEDEDSPTGPTLVVPARPAVAKPAPDAHVKLDGIKRELRSLLDLLGGAPHVPAAPSWPPKPQSAKLEFDANGGSQPVETGEDDGKKAGAKKKAPRSKKE